MKLIEKTNEVFRKINNTRESFWRKQDEIYYRNPKAYKTRMSWCFSALPLSIVLALIVWGIFRTPQEYQNSTMCEKSEKSSNSQSSNAIPASSVGSASKSTSNSLLDQLVSSNERSVCGGNNANR